MNAERILTEPLRIENRIRAMRSEVSRLRLDLQPGGIDYARDRVQASGSGDRVEAILDRVTELEDQIERMQARMDWLRLEFIPRLIGDVSRPTSQDVLRMRYLGGKSMVRISEELHVSYATAYRYLKLGMEEIDRKLI